MLFKLKKFLEAFPSWFYIFFYSITISFFSFLNGLQGDTLFHIKIGEYITRHGIPITDPFSWTSAGKIWFAHEWLWDLLAYKMFALYSFFGIFILHTISILLLVFCVYSFVKDRFIFFLNFILLLNTSLTITFFSLRPQTFVYALYALLLLLISKKEKMKPFFSVLSLFLLFIIWSNIHSSVIFGLGILFLLLVFKKTNWISFVSALLASLINPHGWMLFLYAYKINTLSTTVDRITEWFSPNFHYLPTLFIFLFVLLFLVISAINQSNRKEIYLSMCLFFLTIALFLKSFRHLPFLLITVMFVGYDDRKIQKWMQPVIIFCLIISSFLFQGQINQKQITNPDLSKDFPVEAVAFMKKNGYLDHIFNDYYYGDYLLFTDVKTFIDGRGDLFALQEPELWKDYFDFTGLKIGKPEDILEKYKIKYVLFPKDVSCMKYLKKVDQWKILYEDKKDIVLGLMNGK
jgi:hypothetical protein